MRTYTNQFLCKFPSMSSYFMFAVNNNSYILIARNISIKSM